MRGSGTALRGEKEPAGARRVAPDTIAARAPRERDRRIREKRGGYTFVDCSLIQ